MIKTRVNTSLAITAIIAVIVFYSIALVLLEVTLVPVIWLGAGVLFVGALTGAALWQKWIAVTGSHSFAVNFVCNVVFVSGLLACAVLGVNYWGRSSQAAVTDSVPVTKVYTEEHHRSRRVGRRYVQGEAYMAYYIEVELPKGYRKKIAVNAAEFRRTHTGDSTTVKLIPGALGMPVIER